MEYPHRTDTHFVRCLKCMKILKCSRYDTSMLLDHIRTDHPEIEIIESCANRQTENLNCADKKGQLVVQAEKIGQMLSNLDKSNKCQPMQSSEINICKDDDEEDAKVIYTRRYQVNTSDCPQSPHRRKLYRTSIERWRPATGTIYCPKCGVRKRPLIKTRAERYSTNQCGAACILGCWPFCFLPCLFPGDNKEYLHCANCKNFLGLYDRECNCVKPNREFVEATEAAKTRPVPVACDENAQPC